MSESPAHILTEAATRISEGNLVEALQRLRSLARIAPDLPEINYLLARCYNELGRHDEALDYLQRELKIQPNHGAAKELSEFLAEALSPPLASGQPTGEQYWRSSIPREFLKSLQRRLHNFSYMDVPLLKNPFDLAIYANLLWTLNPRTIVEVGSKSGGSALWFAHQMDAFRRECRIVSIDLVRVENISHPRIVFLEGDANHLEQTEGIDWASDLEPPLLIIDDANHEASTCMRIADFIHPLLRSGDYLVIEDGIISDLYPDAYPNASSGPHVAIRHILERYRGLYVIDRVHCDMFGYNATWSTNGFLKRI
jgi:cephalosporin hydroxylase